MQALIVLLSRIFCPIAQLMVQHALNMEGIGLNPIRAARYFAGVAQLIECIFGKNEVVGLTPTASSGDYYEK